MTRRSKAIRKRTDSRDYQHMLAEVVDLLQSARQASVRAVNIFMTTTYWRIGKRIVESEQMGQARAGYGEELLARLAVDLTREFGRGFSRAQPHEHEAFLLVMANLAEVFCQIAASNYTAEGFLNLADDFCQIE